MRKFSFFLMWLAGTVSVWLLLGRWIPSGVERFYLLVLPAAVVLTGILSRNGWTSSVQLGKRFLGGMTVLSALAALSMLPPVLTFALAKERIWPEVLWFSYLMATVCMLFLSCYTGITLLALRILGIQSPESKETPMPSRNKWTIACVKSAVMIVVFVAALPYMVATFLVLRPKLPNVSSPDQFLERKVQDVAFTTADGIAINGWFVPCKDAQSQRTVLVCHGVGINRSNALIMVHVADALNANALFFDFRGHGESAGHTTTLGHQEKHDVIAAVRYLRKHRPNQAKKIIGIGQSMGAASLARGAAEVEPPLDAVVLDSGFASAMDVTDGLLAAFPPWLRNAMLPVGTPLASLHAGCWLPDNRPEDCVGRLRAPVLIIHARTDGLIFPDHAHRLYARAKQPKSLWISETDGHTSSAPLALEEYIHRVRELVDGSEISLSRRKFNPR